MIALPRLVALAFVFAVSLLYSVAMRPEALSGGTVTGVVFATVSSVPLICVVWLGAWVLASVLTIPNMATSPRLLRYGSYTRALLADTGRSAGVLGAAAVVFWAGALIGAAGLPVASAQLATAPAFTVYENAHLPQLVAILIQAAWLAGALLLVRAMMLTLFLTSQRRVSVVILGLALWVWGALAIAGPELPLALSPNVYLDAAASADSGMVPWALAAGCVVAAGCIFASRSLGRPFRSVFIPGRWLVYAVTTVLSIASVASLAHPAEASLGDTINVVFYGGEGTILQFLVSAFIYLGFAYLTLETLADTRTGWIPLQLLRYGSAAKWFLHWFGGRATASMLLSMALLLLTAAIYAAEGGRDYIVGPVAVYQLLVNGMLQLVAYCLVVLLAVVFFDSRVAGLVVIGIALVARPPQAVLGPWLPVQAAAMSLSTVAAEVTVALIATIVAGLASITLLIRQRPTLER